MAYLFDDASLERLIMASAPLTAAPMSVSAWVYPDANQNNGLFCLYDGTSDEAFALLLQSGNTAAWFARHLAVNASASSANTATLNTWNHVVGVESASNGRSVRLNGGTAGTDSTSKIPSGINAMLLASSISGAGDVYLSGRLAEVGVWNVALTADEQIALSVGYSPTMIRPGNLVAYWPMDRTTFNTGAGAITLDRWRNGYSLTEVNTPAIADHPPMKYFIGPR